MTKRPELKRVFKIITGLSGFRELLLTAEQRDWLDQWRKRRGTEAYAASLDPTWTDPDPIRSDIERCLIGDVPAVLDSDSAEQAAEKYQRFRSGE